MVHDVWGNNPPPITDAQALDAMSSWLCRPDIEGQWGSACDFIEFAGRMIDRTGRSTDPIIPEDDEDEDLA